MMLDQKDTNFIKSLLGNEDVRRRFAEVVEKFIDELKDIETLPPVETEKAIIVLRERLDTVRNLRAIIQRILAIASIEEGSKPKSGI